MCDHSEQINELAGALALAQAEIQDAAKTKTNPGFKSQYADLASIWDACRPALTKHGLSVCQVPQCEGETVYLVSMLLHKSGQWIAGRYPIRPVKQDPQGYGSALTYARRYSLAAMVGVAPDDDDDGNGASHPRAQQATAAPRRVDTTVHAAQSAPADATGSRPAALCVECGEELTAEQSAWFDTKGVPPRCKGHYSEWKQAQGS